jgi:hypothetical protein
MASDQVKLLEEAVADSRRRPEQLESLGQELKGAQAELARAEAERARVAAEEVELAGALNNEQGRWSDLNRSWKNWSARWPRSRADYVTAARTLWRGSRHSPLSSTARRRSTASQTSVNRV